jgi:hypothetical protein
MTRIKRPARGGDRDTGPHREEHAMGSSHPDQNTAESATQVGSAPHDIVVDESTSTLMQTDSNHLEPVIAPISPISRLEEASATAIETDSQWDKYRRFVDQLARRGELAQVEAAVNAGSLSVSNPDLLKAAIQVRRDAPDLQHWNPAPKDDELADLSGWIANRLEEQERSTRHKRWLRQLARLEGRPNAGNGAGTPMHRQRSRFDVNELARRLNFVITRHTTERGEFRREFLDHRSPHYIAVKDGGIGNKQIVMLAHQLVPSDERRDFDANWAIVKSWLSEQQSE